VAETPPGFRTITARGVTLVVDAACECDARALGLLAPGGALALFASHPQGAKGRAPTALVALPRAGGRMLLRRLRHGGLVAPLLRGALLGLGRPLRELAVTARLHEAGAPVPRPLLVVGWRLSGPLWSAAVGTTYEEGSVDLLAFLRARPDRARALQAFRELGRAVRRFHDAGGRHGDLQVKNLLLREEGGRVRGLVIDLDKARVTPGLTPGERMAQIMRLFRSLRKRGVLDQVGLRGCARFFAAYCGDDRALRRAMWRRVDRELRVVALHAWRYGQVGASGGGR
jgi:3-deoxy-D-manno-octulosonic acid kinase